MASPPDPPTATTMALDPDPPTIDERLAAAGRRLRPHADRAWRDLAYLLLGMATGTAFFSIAVTLFSLSIGLLVLIVGIPIAMLSSEVLRWCAEIERRRALIVDPEPIRGAYRPVRGAGWLGAAQAMAGDARRWKDLAYLVLQFPVSVAAFVASSLWALPLGLLTLPLWYWAVPDGVDVFAIPGSHVDALPSALLGIPLGLVAIVPVYGLCRGATIVSLALERALLGDERVELQRRVSHLEETRAGAVDAATAELKRIERDLHDGAQARMVAVAMDLGMAEERLEEDPEKARELVRGARDEARRALAEMRDLVRGIAPSVLADRGLDAALTALATRSPLPVALDVALERRPPASAETAAYFVVSEALTNAAKHAGATACSVTVRGTERILQVEIRDDGAGGAVVAPGGGLAGLRDRVAAVDGMLEVTSPAGGPTVLRATIPCLP
ncbi:sensor domain-containing protein [Patulibacter brassicae]|jgi:signal transduction histidine kinase|uniref:histidine kinase n=1 Tax=Patulibacter brassicae TaxID=1705717 RepID=A0ABU4VII5_9ACTN|nr:sensor domain-containing protein [Patulibacter brassicae]MDX8151157.1 sensor domain-containing protein [Patulibacter brassicae]